MDALGSPMIDERRDDGIDNDKDWISYLDITGASEDGAVRKPSAVQPVQEERSTALAARP